LTVLAARASSQIQQQILKARRSGKAYDAEESNVMKKRLKVSKFMNGTMDKVAETRPATLPPSREWAIEPPSRWWLSLRARLLFPKLT